VRAVLEEVCRRRHATLYVVGDTGPRVTSSLTADRTRQLLTIEGTAGKYEEMACPLLGMHQAENAAVAVGLIDQVAEAVGCFCGRRKGGIENVRWPGRFQVVSRRPTIVLDGAHDEVGAVALAQTIKLIFPEKV